MTEKFTGGDHLTEQDGLKYYIHQTMMLNELSGGTGAYKISNAKNAASGPSFGPIQYDLGSNSKGQQLFEEIAQNAVDVNGHRIINDEQLRQIKSHLYQPFNEMDANDKQVYANLKPLMDKALSSDEGKQRVNIDYDHALDKKVNYVHSVVNDVSTPENKTYLENSMKSQVMIADIKNQYGTVVNERLKAFLNQTAQDDGVQLPNGGHVAKVNGAFDASDISAFRNATAYGINHREDAKRRDQNINNVVGDVKIEKMQTENKSVSPQSLNTPREIESHPQLSKTAQTLITDATTHTKQWVSDNNREWNEQFNQAAHSVAHAAHKEGLTGINLFLVKDGEIHFAQRNHLGTNVASVDAKIASNTDINSNLQAMADIDQTRAHSRLQTQEQALTQGRGRSV